MSGSPIVWKEQRQVESFEIDMKGRLAPDHLFAWLLNCAWKHATGGGFGFEDLSERNEMWVLALFELAIRKAPRWGETVQVETWGKGIEKLFALRDFSVTTPNGEKIASATSAWMILDKTTHRPLRTERMRETFPMEPGRSEMQTCLKKVDELTGGTERARFRAVFSDIDVNEHVTARRYVRWMLDSFPRGVLEESQPRSLQVSFLAEAALDDEVAVFTEHRDGHDLCSVRRESDKKELCRARILWTG